MNDQELIDQLAIRDLKSRYCTHLDNNETEALFSLFTDDAVLNSVGMRGKHEGRAGIREWCEIATDPGWRSAHMALVPTIEVEGDEATGHWYSLVFIMEDGEVELGQGEYQEEYRRVDGEWKFSYRSTERNVTVHLGRADEPSVGL